MNKIKILPLVLSLGVCFLAAGIGAAFTAVTINTWYSTLNKPFFSPPNWVFGPVWILLYFMMAISLYIVWIVKKEKKAKRQGITFFFIQLALNAYWPILFFGFSYPPAALIEIIFLWLAIFSTIRSFLKISRSAGWLLIPYIVWVSFASVLNLAIVILNR